MSNFRSIPLTLSGSGAAGARVNIRRVTAAEELGLASNAEYITVTQYPVLNFGHDSARNYYGSIDRFGVRAADSDMVSIGSFTDTFYAQAVGTHPATSLSTSTTSTPLFQCKDSSDTQHPSLMYPTTSGDFRARLIALDSDGDIRELDSAQTIAFGKRMLETSLSNELVGAFRIGVNTPTNGTWEKWNTDAYTDTTSSALTNYHVFRKTVNALDESPATPGCLGLRDSVDGIVDNTGTAEERGSHDIRQLFYEQPFALAAATLLARKHSELGKMVLLPSTQTPASTGQSGTWQTRGSIVDTVNTTENIQYASEYFTSISRTEQFTGSFTGQYTRNTFADIPQNFVGARGAQYSGLRTNFQKGLNAQFAGQRFSSANYIGQRNYGSAFAGPRQFTGQRNFGSQFAGQRDFLGLRTTYENFIGPRSYTGFTKFIGVAQFLQFVGSRSSNGSFIGEREASSYFVGQRQYAGTRPFISNSGQQQNGSVSYAKFAGDRDFLGQRAGGSASWAGTRNTTTNFIGERQISVRYLKYFRQGANQQWISTRQNNVYNPRELQFGGQRQVDVQRPVDADFAGQRQAETQKFVSIDTANTFIGNRDFTNQYVGSRPATFAGQRDAEYIAQYTGTYTNQFTRNYIGQFSTQYTGATLTNIANTLETYTLYCKVSET